MKTYDLRTLAITAAALTLIACVTPAADPLAENIDPNTGTTVAVASKALELVSESGRSTARDPFAYIGPFETNTQGTKKLFLWLAVPQDKGNVLEPTLMCNDQSLTLAPMQQGLENVGLSQPPYKKPAPWSVQWFYPLSEENLACLAEAKRISVVTRRASNQAEETFTTEGSSISVITAFAASR